MTCTGATCFELTEGVARRYTGELIVTQTAQRGLIWGHQHGGACMRPIDHHGKRGGDVCTKSTCKFVVERGHRCTATFAPATTVTLAPAATATDIITEVTT